MHWNDHSFSGERDEWAWFVSRSPIAQLLDLTKVEHLGARLWICTFDSGTITPSEEEVSAGWSVVDEAMVSPPMSISLDVPCDQYDEWYIFPDSCSRLRDIERFVNYGGFTLADPRSMAASFDASWEPNGLDWLYPLQERFWMQIERLKPISYVATGDNDVIVTRNVSFAAKLRETMKSGPNNALQPTCEHARG